ncbi:MAG: zinc ribbon domain-containing protein, partial [Slackia sp.]|nr:zinc ribbon domain-containing protein [Slackia sp.]
MARFCTWCGAPLEPGARFCGECGGRILETVMVDGSKRVADELSGFDIVDGRKLPADATLRLDRDSVVVLTDTEPKRFSLDSVKKRRRPLVIALCVAAVLLSGAVAFFALTHSDGQDASDASPDSAPPLEATPSTDAPDDESAAASDKPAAASIKDKEDVTLTEGEIFDAVDAAYGDLSAFEERIGGEGGLVEEFNASFLADSMSVRTRAKETADTVLADLKTGLDALNAIDIPAESAYAKQRDAVALLYEYQ